VPNWVNFLIQKNTLSDETQLFKMGFAEEHDFFSVINKLPQPSSKNRYPTPDAPYNYYKFTGLEFNMSPDSKIINRETDGLLDWLGD